MFACASEKNDRRLAAAFDRGAEKVHAVSRAETVIHQANVMLVDGHGPQAELEGFFPVESEPTPAHFAEKIARDDKIILVILDEQDFYERRIQKARIICHWATPQFEASIRTAGASA